MKRRGQRGVNSERVKRALIKARNTIRKKFRELHNQRLNFDYSINETYKPITEPLQALFEEKTTIKKEKEEKRSGRKKEIKKQEPESDGLDWDYFETPSSSAFKTARADRRRHSDQKTSTIAHDFHSPDKSNANQAEKNETFGGIDDLVSNDDDEIGAASFVSPKRTQSSPNVKNSSLSQELIDGIEKIRMPILDKPYGLRVENDNFLLGKDTVNISGEYPNAVFRVKAKDFRATIGLIHLLMVPNPSPSSYTDADLQTYKKMLMLTNAHKLGFKRNGMILRMNASRKYNNIIKQLFPPLPAPIGTRRNTVAGGEGLNCRGGSGDSNFTYWDNPNELVDRLRILIASKSAGHTGHKNEMISIIDELRKAKIIK